MSIHTLGHSTRSQEALVALLQDFVQDESETLVTELLAPEPGETILDLCAAPGGKTTQIQEARYRS